MAVSYDSEWPTFYARLCLTSNQPTPTLDLRGWWKRGRADLSVAVLGDFGIDEAAGKKTMVAISLSMSCIVTGVRRLQPTSFSTSVRRVWPNCNCFCPIILCSLLNIYNFFTHFTDSGSIFFSTVGNSGHDHFVN